jgi:ribosome biogenesis GTPase
MKKVFQDIDFGDKREKLKISTKSKVIRKVGKANEKSEEGVALSVIGKTVVVEPFSEPDIIYVCTVSGRMTSPHKNSTIVAVGDYVKFLKDENVDDNIQTGRIIEIKKRFSTLSRKAAGKGYSEHVIAANIDKVLFLFSTYDPGYNTRFLDRLLISAEIGSVSPAICINKIDIEDNLKDIRKDFKIYKNLKIPIFYTSAVDNTGIEKINKYLKNSTTLLFGQSGVGKSTLINLLLGDSRQKVMEVSDRSGKGQHATSFVRMFNLPKGGKIIDSPGVREFGMWDIDKENLGFYFHDFDKYYPLCKYQPCTHEHEPDCAVFKAFEDGKIEPARYESYLNILNTLDEDLNF